MSSISNLLALHEAQYGPREGAPSTGGSAFAPFVEMVKKQQDEKRRQDNVKSSISQFQQMAKQMQEMGDNSNAGKTNAVLGDDVAKTRRKISVKTMLPQQEMSVDETGALNMKIGFRQATPQEQNAQVEMQAKQMEIEKQTAKSDLLSAFIKGQQSEGALMQAAPELGITPEEIDFAYQAKQRMVMPGQLAQGQSVMAQGQPAYQPFSLAERKAQAETEEKAKIEGIKSQNAIDRAGSTIKTIDHLIQNKNYFGPLEGRVAPVFAGKIEFDKNYKNLQANAVMDVLSEMKNQSKTGATGFGALNEKELSLIMDAASKLDTKLDEKTAEKYLNEMKVNLQTIIDREKNGYAGVAEGKVPSLQNAQPSITREQAIAELKRRGKL